MNTLTTKNENKWAGLVARLTLAIILFPHGAQKMLGLFGGFGFTGTMDFFTNVMHLPWIIGFLVIIIEFIGSVSLLAGLGTRIWAILLIIVFLGIIFSAHIENGFFMNWSGNQKGEGYEFHVLIIGMALILLFTGSGQFSMDHSLNHKKVLKK